MHTCSPAAAKAALDLRLSFERPPDGGDYIVRISSARCAESSATLIARRLECWYFG